MAYRFLLSWRWAGWLLLAALFAAACIGLGNWQMERRNQTVTEIRRVQQNYDRTPVPFQDARASFDVADPDAKWRTVVVSGRYLAEDQRIIRNRPNNSVAGYEVVVPLRLASGETIAVNRGWLPIGNTRPGYPDAVPAPPAGEVSAVVRIKPSEPDLGRDAPEGQLASIDLSYYASQLGYPLLAGSYGVMASESPQPATVPQPLAPPAVKEGSNLSYALQWITFGVLAFVGFGYMARQQARMHREERDMPDESAETASTAQQPRAPAPRKRSRVEEEDALLDSMGL
ncbi:MULTISPECIES: SURF1 family protein [Micrococcaceae]|uniref:SURF1 family cytochrome oxidase biogenesis protein n=1 Tax=Micrococcaceae TaxID=1268 RepID=UPI001E374319|nr:MULTISPECIES: SURF1 family protein [Micrococcaceae]MCD4850748.1 SURF1 family protein [Arthrobacter sp. AK01]MCP1415671.1 cytochrome oxidase assembly protein ShyY1 [Paenarthrobacter sp. A20]